MTLFDLRSLRIDDKLTINVGTITSIEAGWALDVQDVTRENGKVIAVVIGTKSTAFTSGEKIFTMPSGFLPRSAGAIVIWQGNGGNPGASTVMFESTGAVNVYGQSGSNRQVRMTLVYRAAA